MAFVSCKNELLILHFECYRSSGVGLLSAIKEVSIFLKMSCILLNYNYLRGSEMLKALRVHSH